MLSRSFRQSEFNHNIMTFLSFEVQRKATESATELEESGYCCQDRPRQNPHTSTSLSDVYCGAERCDSVCSRAAV